MGARTTLLACPACGRDDIEAVSDGEDTHFLCRSCDRYWHVELGWVWQVSVKGVGRWQRSLRS